MKDGGRVYRREEEREEWRKRKGEGERVREVGEIRRGQERKGGRDSGREGEGSNGYIYTP